MEVFNLFVCASAKLWPALEYLVLCMDCVCHHWGLQAALCLQRSLELGCRPGTCRKGEGRIWLSFNNGQKFIFCEGFYDFWNSPSLLGRPLTPPSEVFSDWDLWGGKKVSKVEVFIQESKCSFQNGFITVSFFWYHIYFIYILMLAYAFMRIIISIHWKIEKYRSLSIF